MNMQARIVSDATVRVLHVFLNSGRLDGVQHDGDRRVRLVRALVHSTLHRRPQAASLVTKLQDRRKHRRLGQLRSLVLLFVDGAKR